MDGDSRQSLPWSNLPSTTSRQAAAEHALDAIDTDDAGFGLWRPLAYDDSIRLFTLTRDPTSGLLVFSLTEHRLSENPDYFAVSYAWGKIGNVAIVEASIGHRALRRNLHAVLHNLHLRMQRGELDDSTKFWVDALCINQESLEEKSQQVQQIGKTFKQAKKVLVWLGTHQDGGRSCLDPIFGSSVAQPRWGRLSTHNYWTRVWIIQEFVLATDLVLMDELHWISGSRLLDKLDSIPSDNDVWKGEDGNPCGAGSYETSLMGRIVYMRFRRLINPEIWVESISSIVARFCEQSCSDIRDKVYALMSLSNSYLRVDYTITPGNLFWATITEANITSLTLNQIERVLQALDLLPCQVLSLPHLKLIGHPEHDTTPNIRPTERYFNNNGVTLKVLSSEIRSGQIALNYRTTRKACGAGDIFRDDLTVEYLLVNGKLEPQDLIFKFHALPFALILQEPESAVVYGELQVCGIAVICHQNSITAQQVLKSIRLKWFNSTISRNSSGKELVIYPSLLGFLLVIKEEISNQQSSWI